jgi:transcriptional regulator with XRE-family HTH domain
MGTPRHSADADIDNYVAEELRIALLRLRIPQAKVCEALHLSQSQVSTRLNGRVPMTASEIVTVAQLTGRDAVEFFPKLPRRDSNLQPTDLRLTRVSFTRAA